MESVNAAAAPPFPWRLAALGAISGALYVYATAWQPPLPRSAHHWYVLWFSALFGLYMLAVLDLRSPGQASHPLFIPLIVAWALIFRALVLWVRPGFLSDDIYRYVWDGLVQRAGINPYSYPPEAPELAFLRDDSIFPMINRKWALTIYPPAAQGCFRLLAWLWPANVIAMKGAILLADGLSLAILLRLLKRLGLRAERLLLYAWHPLVIVELGLSGHLDGLMIPFVLLALMAMQHQHFWRLGAALAGATLFKLYPAILLPVFYRWRDWRLPLAFFGCLALGYGLYLDAGRQIIGYLPYYLAPDEYHNLSVKPILIWLAGSFTPAPHAYVKWLSVLVLVVIMVQCARQSNKTLQQAVHWSIALIALYLLLVSPSVYQWYLIWLVALVPLAQNGLTPAWLYWSWSVNLDYLEAWPSSGQLLYWLRLAEYLPLFLWIIGFWWFRRAGKPLFHQRHVVDATC